MAEKVRSPVPPVPVTVKPYPTRFWSQAGGAVEVILGAVIIVMLKVLET